jgi:hypothetical protein
MPQAQTKKDRWEANRPWPRSEAKGQPAFFESNEPSARVAGNPSKMRAFTLNIVMNQIDIFQNHFKALFPEIFFLVAITIILLYNVIYNPSAHHRYPILINLTGWLGIQSLLLTILLLTN